MSKESARGSALAQKIARRLAEMGELDPEVFDVASARIERFYPGAWQRRAGAWSWTLGIDRFDGRLKVGKTFGSQFTATECVRAKEWHFYATGPDQGIMPSAGNDYRMTGLQ